MIKLTNLSNRRFDSSRYWQRRYAKGRTSGAGSYGRLAKYKADTINGLVRDLAIDSVIEFGSGDGNQTSLFNIKRYTGIDISPLVIERARSLFSDRSEWRFETANAYRIIPGDHEMSMSLDVIYHLVEDEVFDRYMRDLVTAASRYVLIYSSDHDGITDNRHVRHRNYSVWLAEHASKLNVIRTFNHPYAMQKGTDPQQTTFAFFRLFERREHEMVNI